MINTDPSNTTLLANRLTSLSYTDYQVSNAIESLLSDSLSVENFIDHLDSSFNSPKSIRRRQLAQAKSLLKSNLPTSTDDIKFIKDVYISRIADNVASPLWLIQFIKGLESNA